MMYEVKALVCMQADHSVLKYKVTIRSFFSNDKNFSQILKSLRPLEIPVEAYVYAVRNGGI